MTEILCGKCNKNNIYKHELYICCQCKKNLCPLCKSKHKKEHNIINYENKIIYVVNIMNFLIHIVNYVKLIYVYYVKMNIIITK